MKALARKILNFFPRGLSRASVALAQETIIAVKHQCGRLAARKYANDRGIKLHVGCGTNIKPGWVNVGFIKEADLAFDLRERIPLPDQSCSIIFSEHVVEHLEYDDAIRFFQESFRLLEPDGVFSAGVPDAETDLREYAANNEAHFEKKKKHWNPTNCESPMEVINFVFRQWSEHKFAYDYRTLEASLRKAGFKKIHRREFDPNLDTEWRRAESLYIEAIR